MYYILVHSVSGAAATADYTLNVPRQCMGVSATSLSSAGNAGNVTVEVDGTNFAANVSANLKLGATTISATAIDYVNSSKFFATFDLSGAAVGSYAFNVVQGVQSVAAPTPFQVVSAAAGDLEIHLITPEFVRSGRTASIVVTYANTTSNDIAAPLLTISSTNGYVLFSSPANPSSFAATAEILAPDPNGPAGVIPPGQSGQITFTIKSNDTIDGDVIPIHLAVTPAIAPLSAFSQLRAFASERAGSGGRGGSTDNRTSNDPNDIVGPGGYGSAKLHPADRRLALHRRLRE